MAKIDRDAVYKKYNRHCAYCGKFIEYCEMQVDHLKPKRNGGTDDIDNLMPSCRRCNHYKRAESIENFRIMLMCMKHKVLDNYLGNVAVDYGMVDWKGWDGKFFFERDGGEQDAET